MHEALELRGQHQEHDDHGEQQRGPHLAAAAYEVRGITVPHQRGGGRQLFRHGLFEPLHGLAHRVAFGQARADLDGPLAVEAAELGGTGRLGQPYDRRQWYERPGAIGADLQVRKVGHGGALVWTPLQHHVVFTATVDEGGDDA